MVEFLRALALEAGERLLRARGRLTAGQIDQKGRRNLVTAADREVEELVAGRILAAWPADAVMAEESIRRPGTSGRVWIVDPLDGTTNFVHDHPLFCISIALAEGFSGLPAAELPGMGPGSSGLFVPGDRPRPIAAVVHAPALGETFSAERGAGAWLNGRRLQVSATSDLEQALVATGFAYRRNDLTNPNLGNFARMVMAARDVRRGGAAALDLAYVAAGRFDAYWELYLKPWDVAAGQLLVEEAGGRVTDFSGGDTAHEAVEVLATNGRLHEDAARLLEGPDPAWAAGERAELFGPRPR